MSMFECHSCRRHIRITEVRCPFCAAKPASVEAPLGLGTLIFALGLSLAACGGSATEDEAESESTSTDSTGTESTSTESTSTESTSTESDEGASAYTVSGSEWDSESSAGTTDTDSGSETGTDSGTDTGTDTGTDSGTSG